jgi:hypothetical protein
MYFNLLWSMPCQFLPDDTGVTTNHPRDSKVDLVIPGVGQPAIENNRIILLDGTA